MTTIPLPFARGDVWASGVQGAAPTDIIGARVTTPEGLELEIVLNRNGAVLYGTQAVAWKNPHVTGAVEATDANNQKNVAGIVDPMYADKGVTIADGSLFWAVKRGDTYVRAGAACTPGQSIITDAGASALAEGRTQPLVPGGSAAAAAGAVIGAYLATGVAASVINTGSVLARVHIG